MYQVFVLPKKLCDKIKGLMKKDSNGFRTWKEEMVFVGCHRAICVIQRIWEAWVLEE